MNLTFNRWINSLADSDPILALDRELVKRAFTVGWENRHDGTNIAEEPPPPIDDGSCDPLYGLRIDSADCGEN